LAAKLGSRQGVLCAKARHDVDFVASMLAEEIVYTFPLNANGTTEPWFTYDGKQATVD
jgi:hypothetical protein